MRNYFWELHKALWMPPHSSWNDPLWLEINIITINSIQIWCYLGEIRCNVMSVDFGNLPPKENIKFGMTPLSAKDKIKNFRKATLPSFVTHWNLWPHLLNLWQSLLSLTSKSSRGGAGVVARNTISPDFDFFFLSSHCHPLVWGEKRKNMSRISVAGVPGYFEKNVYPADSTLQFSFPEKYYKPWSPGRGQLWVDLYVLEGRLYLSSITPEGSLQ